MITGWGNVRVEVCHAHTDPEGANAAQIALWKAGRREHAHRVYSAFAAVLMAYYLSNQYELAPGGRWYLR